MESNNLNRYWQAALPSVEKHGFRCYFVNMLERDVFQDWANKVGIRSAELGCRNAMDYPSAVFKMKRIIEEVGPAVVHCSESIASAIGGLAARSASVPAVFHRHHCHSEGKRAILAAIGSHACQLTMAVSEASASFAMRENGLPADRVRVVRNGVAPPRDVSAAEVQSLRSSLGIPADAAVLTMVARLRTVKGHSTLFQSLPSVRAKINKPLHLLVVGSGPEESLLRAEAAAIQNVTVHFVGHSDDIALWYRAADVAVMPSLSEPFGLVAVEAMSAGVPLVASAVQGLLEIVEDGRSGLLVPPNSPPALADAVVRLLSDPTLRERIVVGGRERYLNHFTTEAMVRGWTDCYRSVLSRTRSAAARTA